MTKDVILDSRNKSYSTQCKLLSRYSGYEAPRIYEAAISIFMEHVRNGQRLYNRDPVTYTRCQETYEDKSWPMVSGGFDGGGLRVGNAFCEDDLRGVGGVRKFL